MYAAWNVSDFIQGVPSAAVKISANIRKLHSHSYTTGLNYVTLETKSTVARQAIIG
jgi:hypothetical protein